MAQRFALFPIAVLIAAVCLIIGTPLANVSAAEDGFRPIFEGDKLTGWDGNTDFWSAKDGVITGQTTKENPTKGNTFLVWRQGKVDDFELRFSFRIVGGNSGVQYRSKEHGKWVIGGYQADFDAAGSWTGTLYEERGRGVLARRGNKVVVGEDGKKQNAGKTTDEKELLASIKKEDWNEYAIIARGNHLIQKVNGHVTIDVTDNQASRRAMSGLLALQLHAGPPMTVQFKDLRLKRLPLTDGRKKVVFVAGGPSHGYFSHEHNAGSLLLAKALSESMPNILPAVYRNGWPKDPTAFDNADSVVMYCDGGGGHMVNNHLDANDAVAKRGVGMVCLHYGVETPSGKPGNKFLDWIGGYFEAHWSVNPHWVAKFTTFPDHPISRGVKPFEINDEWYYHMRFREGMKGVTPILSDIPPKSTLSRPDGAHSGNKFVRAAAGTPQHVAWASENVNGGRGFGFTGGHFHKNWANDNFRKVVLNAIVWTAQAEVPAAGVGSTTPTQDDLEANQDSAKPKPRKPKKSAAAQLKKNAAKGAFRSRTVTARNPVVDINVDITGAKKLFLVVRDAGDGMSCDWANWAEPRLVGLKGVKKLTDLKWTSASAGHGQVHKNGNSSGGQMRIAGKSVAYGIGTHSESIISYDLPAGYKQFKARGGLDNGGTDQGACGEVASVKFEVYTDQAPVSIARRAQQSDNSHDPQKAVANLEVAPGVEATLFASEPMMLSPSNIDIDERGRVWVCEVVNYRRHSNKRKEGDRILILEDTTGDGKADSRKVYYQGRDVDSALGICVLGNKVIVSCSPNVFVFTDTDGDDKPDKKEILFSGISGAQHDHTVHAFLFGPDGKLYFNAGNVAKQINDRDGKPIVDLAGNVVNDKGNPYRQGMVYRCNMDGSQFETLGWNFRNNYEVTVDSFGTIWQSDNDDDGNRGVRINFVMEFGNYGYTDEFTGAGWRTKRTGMHTEIPKQHWYLRDPGVVPNLLQTGGGSPTGILLYEGSLLPKVFQNQMIHCDAGPSVTRAYPVENDGAGYKATTVNILEGVVDKWFRPADACVAPDGSLFVADWYDPGVGGHGMGDLGRGRIFRVAPPGTAYRNTKPDVSTAAGAIRALKSPNLATRYLGWTALHDMGASAKDALLGLYKSDNPRFRARALWLLSKIDGSGADYARRALNDADSDIRITALRALRQLNVDIIPAVQKLVHDKSPQVRRECAIALRHNDSADAAGLWVELALQHDIHDRWYLEALGLSADKQWDAFLDAWLARVGDDWNSTAGRQIIWRSRATKTADYLARIIADKSTPEAELPRMFRAFHFVGGDKQKALSELAFAPRSLASARNKFIAQESIARIEDTNLSASDSATLGHILKQFEGTSEFVAAVKKFRVKSRYADLLAIAQSQPNAQLGVEAMRGLLANGQAKLIQSGIADADPDKAIATIAAMTNSADGRVASILWPVVNDKKQADELRRQAVKGVAATRDGAVKLLAMVKNNELDDSIRFSVALPLTNAPWREIRDEAAKLFPLPAGKGEQSLPPIDQLIRMRGNHELGEKVFNTTGTCATCHIVNKKGKEVGPDLSEIGTKLSRSAMFESILYPSAAISHNYETYSLILESGTVVSGLLTSQTASEVTIKNAEGLVRSFPRGEIDEMVKQTVSLMPADLQKTMTARDLADVVNYLSTLKKAK